MSGKPGKLGEYHFAKFVSTLPMVLSQSINQFLDSCGKDWGYSAPKS